MLSLSNPFKSKKRSVEEIEQEIEEVKQQLKKEKKDLENCKLLVSVYEKSKDENGLELTKKELERMMENVEKLKQRKKDLRTELPPRPLPPVQFVDVSMTSKPVTPTTTPGNSRPSTVKLTELKPTQRPNSLYVPGSGKNPGYSSPTNASVIEEQNETNKEKKVEEASLYVVAVYSYQATNADELSFNLNDSLRVLDKTHRGWWKGELNGKVGYFPVNYVNLPTSEVKENTTSSVTPPFMSVALYGYEAQSKDELSFRRGDKIYIGEQAMNGWFRGILSKEKEKNSKLYKLIPGNYIEPIADPIMDQSKSTLNPANNPSAPNNTQLNVPTLNPPTNTNSNSPNNININTRISNSSERSTLNVPTTNLHTLNNTNNSNTLNNTNQNNTTTSTNHARPPKPQAQVATVIRAKVLWDYVGKGQDELKVTVNEEVLVLQQYGYNESDTEWWKVKKITKEEGFVPKAYLEIIKGPARTATAKKRELPKPNETEEEREARLEKERKQREIEAIERVHAQLNTPNNTNTEKQPLLDNNTNNPTSSKCCVIV